MNSIYDDNRHRIERTRRIERSIIRQDNVVWFLAGVVPHEVVRYFI